jgi:hypothetical protein
MARKKRKRTKKIPIFPFTRTSLVLAREAARVYEHVLQRARGEASQLAFARETLSSLCGKLDTMLTANILGLTVFDYNERIVLATAIQLYAIELRSGPPTPQREKKLKECGQVYYFALANLEIKSVKDSGN